MSNSRNIKVSAQPKINLESMVRTLAAQMLRAHLKKVRTRAKNKVAARSRAAGRRGTK